MIKATYFRNVSILSLIALLLSGCAMAPKTDMNGNQFIAYQGAKVITAEEAKELPRALRSSRIQADMENIGFDTPDVSILIDSVSNSILSVFENQYALLTRYTTIVDNHKDVMSFIHANKGKSKDELQAEAERFDRMATSQAQKIGPKLEAYRRANDDIQKENIKLAGELLVQSGRFISVFKDNNEALQSTEVLVMLLNAGKINDAYELAEIRIHLATIANEFIDDEKAVLEITKQIQEILDEKL